MIRIIITGMLEGKQEEESFDGQRPYQRRENEDLDPPLNR